MKQCAAYTRVSTNMQAEKDYNSCEAQKDKILSYIGSQDNLAFNKEYSDPGFTGANLDRPALKELLKDIAAKKIDVVLTYKIDRLTRSSKDFYLLIEFLEKHGVSFVSVSERFDTSSASGRLLRNIMLTFAQFEREMTAERTRDKMLARADKGLWNGGYTPFGYRRENGKLFVDKRKAKIVREVFDRFVITGSLKKTTDFMFEIGAKNPKTEKLFNMNGVFHILRNPAYIGQMVWAKKIYQGIHEPIISKELFDHAQSLTKEKVKKRLLYKEFFVRRLLKCAECGSTMTPYFTYGRKDRYYYYKCYSTVRKGCAACCIGQVNANKLEDFLIENLSRVALDKQYTDNLAFQITHQSPHPAGFEPTKESSKNLATRVSQVLMDFKNRIQKSTQVEKCLIFQRTVKEIKFSREHLEVIVFVRDTIDSEVENFLSGQSGKSSAGVRAGAANFTAPACTTGSSPKNGDSFNSVSNFTLILPHNLLKRTLLK